MLSNRVSTNINKQHLAFAIKNWIRLIYPYLIRITLVSLPILLITYLADDVWFMKILPKMLIIYGILIASFVGYRLLNFHCPFEEEYDLEKRRKHIRKKWWEL